MISFCAFSDVNCRRGQFCKWIICSWALIQVLEFDRLDAMATLDRSSLESHITPRLESGVSLLSLGEGFKCISSLFECEHAQ